MKENEQRAPKMSKRAFISRMAKTNQVTLAEATKAYDMVTKGIVDVVSGGTNLSLVGFGLFYLQRHSGHPAKFGDKRTFVESYNVFKFSASDSLNASVRHLPNG